MEVRLREQLAESYVQGGDGFHLPPSAALTMTGSMGASHGGFSTQSEAFNVVTAPKLQVYSDLFEAIIEADDAFAPLLEKVKAIYDACAEPWLQQGCGQPPVSASSSPEAALDAVAEDSCIVPPGGERLAELGLENRLLRTMAGRLHHEREELRGERDAEEARRKQKANAKPPDWVALAGLLPMGGGLGCQDWLQTQSTKTRPFSAMRVTSHGVRTDQLW